MAQSKKKRKEQDEANRRVWFIAVVLLSFQLGYLVGQGPRTEKPE